MCIQGVHFEIVKNKRVDRKHNESASENTEETRDDFKDNLKILLNDYLKKINVVTREEFDIQSAVLTKTKKKLDELEKKLEKK